MRLVHLSDLHLGFRSFPRRERGWNLRERDLATTFHRTIQEIARHEPEVVLLSGDLFDHPDPPSTAFLTLSRGLSTLRGLLPQVTVLAIAGERDTPFTPADPGPVAVVDALPGVEAAAGAPRAVHLQEHRLHALLVPHRAVLRPPFPELRPDPDARWNILLLRGTPVGRERGADEDWGNAASLSRLPQVDPEGWDYVALGGGHRHRLWRRHVWSAGSLDRVGGNPWREATEEKGFVLFDLVRGEGEFHPVTGRPVVDLAPVRVDPQAPEVGGRRLREVLEGIPGGIEGKIVRIRLQGSVDAPAAALPPGLLRAVERRAAHLDVRVGPEEPEAPEAGKAGGEGAATGVRLQWQGGGEGAVTLGPGLWALVAEAGADRARMVEALREQNGEAPPDPGVRAPDLRLRLEAPAAISAGMAGAVPGQVQLLDDTAGLSHLLRRLQDDGQRGGDYQEGSRGPGGGPEAGHISEEGAGNRGEERMTGGDPKLRFRLREARADWVEAAGDLEARTMEWTRERQEADTRLQTYRDRARELRGRLTALEAQGAQAACPTCARPLAEAHPHLVQLLQEEWETVVQDGKWWKRRREQLENRPEDLRELERQTLRLHARVETLSEGGEEGEGTEGQQIHGLAPEPGIQGEAPAQGGAALPFRVDRTSLRAAGEFLRRISEGEIQGLTQEVDQEVVQGMTPGDPGLRLLREGGEASLPGPGEAAFLAAALLLAGLQKPAPLPGGRNRVGLMTALSGAEGDLRAVRTLEVMADATLPWPVLVVLPPALLTRCPELFQGTVELLRDEDGRLRFRASPGGVAWIHLHPVPEDSLESC